MRPLSGLWAVGAGDTAVGSAVLALSGEDGDEDVNACVIHCPVCQRVERPAWRLEALAVCARCTAVLTVTVAGRGTVAQSADLAAPGYHLNKRNRLVIEDKKSMQRRGIASPDRADALCLTFALPVQVPTSRRVNWRKPAEHWASA